MSAFFPHPEHWMGGGKKGPSQLIWLAKSKSLPQMESTASNPGRLKTTGLAKLRSPFGVAVMSGLCGPAVAQARSDLMAPVHDILLRKLKEHTQVSRADADALGRLSFQERSVAANGDIVRQGDKPHVSVVVLRGMVGRYHTRPGGGRQYISFHISGDMPDLQALFIDVMDHSVCAINDAEIALIPHDDIFDLFKRQLSLGYALWRETLIDAAIFREAVTNNSARPARARMAHFFCEQYYRAKAAGLATHNSCSLPLSQIRLGEALGVSVVTANRVVQALRRSGAVDLQAGVLTVRNWRKLTELGEFDAAYLHLKKQSRI